MKHYIVTRFNLKVDSWKTTRDGEGVLTDVWLKNRFILFETYCLPSVINQINKNFIWCVFFDESTSLSARKTINTYVDMCPNFTPLFINGIDELLSSFQDFIKKDISNNTCKIITSRLDNDDLLHTSYVDTVQNLAEGINSGVIDIELGYQISLEKRHSEIRPYLSKGNAFISFVEKTNQPKTVISKMHQDWIKTDNVVTYNNKPMWIELIHDKNKANSKRLHLKRTTTIENKHFGLHKDSFFKDRWIKVQLANAKSGIFSFLKRLKGKINV